MPTSFQKQSPVNIVGNSVVVDTLTNLVASGLPPKIDKAIVGGSPIVASWTKAAVQSAGSRKVQLPDSRYFENTSTRVTPEMFGAVGDGVTDDLAAFQKALSLAGTSLELTPYVTYSLSAELTITNACNIEGFNLATLKWGGVSTDVINANSNMINIRSSNVTVRGVIFSAPISVVLNVIPGCGSLLRIQQPSGTDVNYILDNINILNNIFRGGQRGITSTSMKNSNIMFNKFEYNFQWGWVGGDTMVNCQFSYNSGYRIGATELCRIGTNPGTFLEDVTISFNRSMFCGLIDPTNLQEGYDIYCKAARRVSVTDNISIGDGAGFMEMKWSDGANTYSEYTDVTIARNFATVFSAGKALAVRLSANTTSTNPVSKVWVKDNNFVVSPFNKYVAGSAVKVDTTSGSPNVTVTVNNHNLSIGDKMFTMYCNIASSTLGGIPLYELLDYKNIVTINSTNTFTVVCNTVATSTANSTLTNANVYFHTSRRLLGSNPIQTTNNSTSVNIVVDAGSTAGQYISLSGIANGVANISAEYWNRKHYINSANSTTVTITLPVTANTTASVGGSNVYANTELYTSSTSGIWYGMVDNIVDDGNIIVNAGKGWLLDNSNTVSADNVSTGFTISNPVADSCQYAVYVRRSTLNNFSIVNPNFNVYTTGVYFENSSIAPNVSYFTMTGGRVELKEFLPGAEAVRLSSISNARISKMYIKGGYGFRQYDTSAYVPASANNIISDCVIDVNNSEGRDAVYLTEGAWRVENNKLNVSNATSNTRGIAVAGGSVISVNNVRTGGNAVPTVAGGKGEIVYNTDSASGAALGWLCTTSGNTSTVVWKSIGSVA